MIRGVVERRPPPSASALVIGDLTRGSGRFNLGQGVVGTAVGVGAACSNLLAGVVARSAGFNASFVTLAAIALCALLLFAVAMPETRGGTKRCSIPAPVVA